MSAAAAELPAMERAAVQELLHSASPGLVTSADRHLAGLALQILHNLKHQHRWTALRVHETSPVTGLPLPRPLVSGRPPRRLYVHPDEQVELFRIEAARKKKGGDEKRDGDEKPDDPAKAIIEPEVEWVLPTSLRESWSLKKFAQVFDSIGMVPPDETNEPVAASKWRTTKRVLLATLSDDSTVVYYIVHDGLVKPRQN